MSSMQESTTDDLDLQRRGQRADAVELSDAYVARPSAAATILALQRGAGNHAVAQMLQRQRPSSELEEAAPAAGHALPPGNVIVPTEESPVPPWRRAPTEAEIGAPLDEVEDIEAEGTEAPVVARWPGSKTKTPKAPKPAKVDGVLTPQDDFAGRSKSSFGVGEIIDLSFKSKPSVTAASLGGLQWEVTAGPATVISALDGTGTLTCGDTPGAVSLALKVATGVDIGTVKATRTLTVVAPADGKMSQVPGTGLRHTHGKAGVAFTGEITLRPKTVSFQWVQMREGGVPAVASGSFAHWNGLAHAVGGWVTIGAGNAATGSRVNATDDIDSGDLDPPFDKGDFLWTIPWEFQVGGGPATPFTTAPHHATSDKKGLATISKKGSGTFKRKANDPTSTV
jgi:hypothetical protein